MRGATAPTAGSAKCGSRPASQPGARHAVGVEERDELGPRRREPGVARGARAAVDRPVNDGRAVSGRDALDRRRVGGRVVDDDHARQVAQPGQAAVELRVPVPHRDDDRDVGGRRGLARPGPARRGPGARCPRRAGGGPASGHQPRPAPAPRRTRTRPAATRPASAAAPGPATRRRGRHRPRPAGCRDRAPGAGPPGRGHGPAGWRAARPAASRGIALSAACGRLAARRTPSPGRR